MQQTMMSLSAMPSAIPAISQKLKPLFLKQISWSPLIAQPYHFLKRCAELC